MEILKFISDSLFLDEAYVKSFSASAPYRYKVYSIPKRNGVGKRIIAHPSKELKFIQGIIISAMQKELVVHSSAKAYKKGFSIKDNAAQHIDNNYLLKMDLKNFFHSITPDIFFFELEASGVQLSDEDKEILKGLIFWRPKRSKKLVLSIGAPSSPLISNFVMYRFDNVVSAYCKQENISYTRYADDLTFSTNRRDILFSFPEFIRATLKDLFGKSLRVNSDKTVFSSKGHNRHITGVTLNNDGRLSVGRKRKREIFSAIHRYSLNQLYEKKVLELKGLFSYASHLDEIFSKQVSEKYGQEIVNKLKKEK